MKPKPLKLIWRVGEAPTGPYRSFYKRRWPTAYYEPRNPTEDTGPPAVFIECEDSYTPAKAKDGSCSLTIVILHHTPVDVKKSGAWERYKLTARAKTVAEAKTMACNYLSSHPSFHPKYEPNPAPDPK